MANEVVQLADVYEPLTFNAAVDEAAIEMNNFIQSGVMVADPLIQAQVAVGGQHGDVAYYGPLGTQEPNYSSDDPATSAEYHKIVGKLDKFMSAIMNEHWSTMDLSRELALKDPMTAITSKIGGYWATQVEKRLIQSAMGVLADNVANDSGDMLYSVATDDAGAVTEAEKVSPRSVLWAAQTLGDHKMNVVAIAMHSMVHAELQAQNVIVTELDPAGQVTGFQTYLGYRVIVDDSLPAVAGTNRITYTSILFGAGAFGNAQGAVAVPSEMDRLPLAGNGGGQSIISSRRNEIIHPYGFQFLNAGIAGQSPTLAELAVATEWDRVKERKNVNIAFLQTNG